MTQAPDLSDFSKEEIKTELDKIRHPVEVAIFGTENYFNAGSIIRTCHAFLVKRIHLIESTKFYKKAAMGAAKYENIEKWESMDAFLQLGIAGRSIVCVECSHDFYCGDIKGYEYPEDPILLFGSEKFGLPDLALQVGVGTISIQQFGLTNSMNVSVCAGIVLQDWMTKNHGRLYG